MSRRVVAPRRLLLGPLHGYVGFSGVIWIHPVWLGLPRLETGPTHDVPQRGCGLGWATSPLENLRSGLMLVLFKRPGCHAGLEEKRFQKPVGFRVGLFQLTPASNSWED